MKNRGNVHSSMALLIPQRSNSFGPNSRIYAIVLPSNDFMDASGLIELPIKGETFTWSNLRCDIDAIVEKLDKILISSEWSLAYPKAIGVLKVDVALDHIPIILIFDGLRKKRKEAFKLKSRWLLEEKCHTNVSEAWAGNPRCTVHLRLNRKLKITGVKLKQWSGIKYGKMQRNRQNAIVKIKDGSGRWIEDENKISTMFQKHFQEVYTKDVNTDFDRHDFGHDIADVAFGQQLLEDSDSR
ncbi:hypothetical protein V6N12_010614 [Hibiscus sabdariffa]|uniref:Uncharacterized protein n=1 Tax=Hibiscus sabdariffa TaxID=183260 RepID=A0ABR2EKM9_9ROSI